MKLGFHFSYSGSLNSLRKKINVSRGNAFQIFARGLRGGTLHEVKTRQLNEYKRFVEERDIMPIVHAPFVYNITEVDPNCIEEIMEDLEFAQKIGAKFYVLRPGSYGKGNNPLIAMENIKGNLLKLIEATSFEGEILIRNRAGGGTQIPHTLEKWNELVSFHPSIKGALDYSAAFSAGYMFHNNELANAFYEEVEEIVGWDKIKLMYINDNERFVGNKKEGFLPIGDGVIRYDGYEAILQLGDNLKKVMIAEHNDELQKKDRTIEEIIKINKGRR